MLKTLRTSRLTVGLWGALLGLIIPMELRAAQIECRISDVQNPSNGRISRIALSPARTTTLVDPEGVEIGENRFTYSLLISRTDRSLVLRAQFTKNKLPDEGGSGVWEVPFEASRSRTLLNQTFQDLEDGYFLRLKCEYRAEASPD